MMVTARQLQNPIIRRLEKCPFFSPLDQTLMVRIAPEQRRSGSLNIPKTPDNASTGRHPRPIEGREGGSMRIGFLFNHDQVHQVAHALPIASALARLRTGAEIVICTTSDRLTDEIHQLAGESIGVDFQLIQLRLHRSSSRLLNSIAGRVIPSAKLLMYRDNLEFFRSLDVLVVPEKTSLILKDHFQLEHLKIVHTRHGAGDRAIGFDKASVGFDHVLASGSKVRTRLVQEAGVDPDKISVVGYPKFDMFPSTDVHGSGADQRPVVLYNPHVAPHLSSWYRSGRRILEWFAEHQEYELIFAPHIMLFERRVVVTVQPPKIALPGKIPARVRAAPNILIDLNSRLLTTMEYLNRADIYLGDASSQVYEFLDRPRPCVFFNAHEVSWENDRNFSHWHAGRVISDVSQLGKALSSADEDHEQNYLQVQRELISNTFDRSTKPPSVRAAEAIARLAGIRDPAKKRSSSTGRSKRSAKGSSRVARLSDGQSMAPV
jgi:hypothetical protein